MIAACLACGAGASAQSDPTGAGNAVASSSNAASNTRLLELLNALNGGAETIAAFAARDPGPPPPPPDAEGPPPPSTRQMMLESAKESGGYSLLQFTEVSDRRATALVRNHLTNQVQEMIVAVGAKPPHEIRGWGFRSLMKQESFQGTSDRERVAEVSAFLKRLDAADTFSGVVVIARDGQPIFQRAYGYADRARRIPNRLETQFRLASMSKLYTGIAIGRLVEQGRLSYDDPLSKFVPDFPDAQSARKIQIKHLLSHTSGLTSFFPPAVHNAQRRGWTSAGIAALPPMRLESEPGTKWEYSNTGLLLLGRVIEIVTGEKYFDHVERIMFGPLGLRRTRFPDYGSATDIALPYETSLDPAGNLGLKVPQVLTRWGGPAGDAAANASDLVRFAQALETGKIVSESTLRLHTTPKPEIASPKYGYAVDFDFEGRDIYGHSGGAPGTCAQLAVIRDLPARYSFVVLGNSHPATCRAVVIKIGNTFVPAPGAASSSTRN